MRRRLTLALLCLLPALPATAWAAPALPLAHPGRWITDARGRVVIVHGPNIRRGPTVLQIASCRKARSVTVTVRPRGKSHGSCRAPAHGGPRRGSR